VCEYENKIRWKQREREKTFDYIENGIFMDRRGRKSSFYEFKIIL
jgi:hypothetical protein